MEIKTITVITIAIIIGYLIITWLIKEKLFTEMRIALNDDDKEKFKKLIFSFSASMFLNQNKVFLMRSNSCLFENYPEAALRWCNLINPKKLNIEDLKEYLQLKMRLVLDNGDEEDIDKLIEYVERLKQEMNAELVEEFVYQLKIYKQLVFKLDENFEKKLLVEADKADHKKKGGLYMMLANYYRINRNEKKALEVERKAKEYLQLEREGK